MPYHILSADLLLQLDDLLDLLVGELALGLHQLALLLGGAVEEAGVDLYYYYYYYYHHHHHH
eukprot:7001648-Heterocapsa_arctica.AAC.1